MREINNQKLINVALTIACVFGFSHTVITKPKDIGLMSVFGSLLILNSKTQQAVKVSESSINQLKVQNSLSCDRVADLEREQGDRFRLTHEKLDRRIENRFSQITQELQQHVSDCEQRYSFELQQQLEHQYSSLEELLLKTALEEPVVAADPNQRPRVLIAIDEANLFFSFRSQELKPDYEKLLNWLKQRKDADYRIVLYTAIDPQNQNQQKFIHYIKSIGCEIVSIPLKKYADGHTKGNLDAEIARTLVLWQAEYDDLLLLSGDGDFSPLIENLRMLPFAKQVTVAAFRANTALDLISAADTYLNLGDPQILAQISRPIIEQPQSPNLLTPRPIIEQPQSPKISRPKLIPPKKVVDAFIAA